MAIKEVYPTDAPKYKVGDHISYRDSYWGRRTGIITEYKGIVRNIAGPGKHDHGYFFTDDATGNTQMCHEMKMNKCRKPNV